MDANHGLAQSRILLLSPLTDALDKCSKVSKLLGLGLITGLTQGADTHVFMQPLASPSPPPGKAGKRSRPLLPYSVLCLFPL
jgi:hypothetical protein